MLPVVLEFCAMSSLFLFKIRSRSGKYERLMRSSTEGESYYTFEHWLDDAGGVDAIDVGLFGGRIVRARTEHRCIQHSRPNDTRIVASCIYSIPAEQMIPYPCDPPCCILSLSYCWCKICKIRLMILLFGKIILSKLFWSFEQHHNLDRCWNIRSG